MNLDLQALETSFDRVAPRGDELMDEFYSRLFDAAPALTPLFAGTGQRGQERPCETVARSLGAAGWGYDRRGNGYDHVTRRGGRAQPA